MRESCRSPSSGSARGTRPSTSSADELRRLARPSRSHAAQGRRRSSFHRVNRPEGLAATSTDLFHSLQRLEDVGQVRTVVLHIGPTPARIRSASRGWAAAVVPSLGSSDEQRAPLTAEGHRVEQGAACLQFDEEVQVAGRPCHKIARAAPGARCILPVVDAP